jgi:hypothetical protein
MAPRAGVVATKPGAFKKKFETLKEKISFLTSNIHPRAFGGLYMAHRNSTCMSYSTKDSLSFAGALQVFQRDSSNCRGLANFGDGFAREPLSYSGAKILATGYNQLACIPNAPSNSSELRTLFPLPADDWGRYGFLSMRMRFLTQFRTRKEGTIAGVISLAETFLEIVATPPQERRPRDVRAMEIDPVVRVNNLEPNEGHEYEPMDYMPLPTKKRTLASVFDRQPMDVTEQDAVDAFAEYCRHALTSPFLLILGDSNFVVMPDFDVRTCKPVDHPVLVGAARGRTICSCQAYEKIVMEARKPDASGAMGELADDEEPCFHVQIIGMFRRQELGKKSAIFFFNSNISLQIK